MTDIAALVGDNLSIWTGATERRPGAGRGRGKRISLYGIARLRALILDLAVRGKLVPQDPNDEPASILYSALSRTFVTPVRTAGRGQRTAIAKGLIDEPPFSQPSGWQWVCMGDLGETNIGLTYSPNDLTSNGIPVLRSNNVQDGGIVLDELVRVAQMPKASVMVNKGDMLICVRNGSRALVGKAAIIPDLPEPMAFGAFMAIFRSPINSYLHLFLTSPIFRELLDEVNTNTINQITQANLRSTLVPLPPLAEQHRIVAKVDELMALCDGLEEESAAALEAHQRLAECLLATLVDSSDASDLASNWSRFEVHFDTLFTTEESIEALKRAILELAVRGRLVPQDSGDEPASILSKSLLRQRATNRNARKTFENPNPKPFDIAEGWAWVQVSDIGHDLGSAEPSSEFTYIDVGAIDQKKGIIDNPSVLSADDAPSRARRIVELGTVLYSTVRPYLLNIVVVDQVFDPSPIASTAFAVIQPYDGVITRYIYHYLRSPTFVAYVEGCQTGIAYPAINDRQFFSAWFPLPPTSEQERIVAKIDALMALCDSLKTSLAEASEIQKHLADAVMEKAAA